MSRTGLIGTLRAGCVADRAQSRISRAELPELRLRASLQDRLIHDESAIA
jgi:hypothetical protein